VLVEAVPFARHRTRFTRDFEDLAAFLTTRRQDHHRPVRPRRLDPFHVEPRPQRVAACLLLNCGIERPTRTLAFHQYQWLGLVRAPFLVCEIDEVGLDVLYTAALG
jgi:hypothetical protein